jgi:DNA replicative helicase MCM subunit Mcm2 (Cdc46/Mcm family)
MVCEGRCRGYQWQPLTEDAALEEVQLLKIQELPLLEAVDERENTDGVAKMVEVELRASLIDSVSAGDVVTVGGIVSTRKGDRAAGDAYQLCIQACSITSRSSRNADVGSSSQDAGDFFEMAHHQRWFDRLVASICPSIYGHEDLKSALLIALAGGTPKQSVRSSVHVLIVGDPGLGKSQLLRAAAAAAPRSSMVCAKTSSRCGLTVTLSRNPSTGETTFEAGATV